MTIKVLLPKLKGKFYLLILRDQGYYRYLFRRTSEQLVKAFSDTLENYRNPKPRDNWKRNSSEFLNRSFGSSYLCWNLQVFDIVNPNSANNVFEDKLDNLARENMFESFMYHVMYKVKTYYETKESLPPGFKLLKRITKKTSNINIELYGEKSSWIVWQGTREEFIDRFCTTEVQDYLMKGEFFTNPNIPKQSTGLSEATTEIDLTKNIVCFYDGSRELNVIHVDLTGYIHSELPRVKERFLFLAQETTTEEDTSVLSEQLRELFDKHTESEWIEEQEKNKRFDLQKELRNKKELEELERFFTTG